MKHVIALALCAVTMVSVALAGDGKPACPKKGKGDAKACEKKDAGKPCGKKEAKGGADWRAGALEGRKQCAAGGHKYCGEKAAGLCKDGECGKAGHKACRAAAPAACEARAKELAAELAGGGGKKGKCEGKDGGKPGDVPVKKEDSKN